MTDLDRTLAWLEGCFSVAGKELDAILAVARTASLEHGPPCHQLPCGICRALDALAALGPATPKEPT